MADVTDEGASRTQAPSTLGRRLRYAGPGIVIAVTGVGAGDMVSSLVAGTDFGMVLLWAVVLGAILKYDPQVLFDRGNRALVHGLWADHLAGLAFAWPVGDLVFRGLSVHRDLRLRGRGNLDRCAGCGRGVPRCASAVGVGRTPQRGGFRRPQHRALRIVREYHEDLRRPEVRYRHTDGHPARPVPWRGRPRVRPADTGGRPDQRPCHHRRRGRDLLVGRLHLLGARAWLAALGLDPDLRTDLAFGYALTALFMVSMLVIGAELLFGTGTSISDEEGLLALVNPLQDRFGLLARWAFLIGFWAVATGAMLGAWNGGAYLFADCVRTIRRVPDEHAEEYLSEKSIFFRAFLAWMTFPPMILLSFGEPVALVIIYASLGALFLPFLAITLLWLLNSQRVAPEYRNRIVSNVVLAVSVIPFIVVGVQEVLGSL